MEAVFSNLPHLKLLSRFRTLKQEKTQNGGSFLEFYLSVILEVSVINVSVSEISGSQDGMKFSLLGCSAV
jgi:hypothetical protein